MTQEENGVEERRKMVDTQIVARGIRDPRVIGAMLSVPRHLFLAPEYRSGAYEDHPVRIDCGQTMSQPYIVALMTELLELEPGDRVLEIGTGSGYQAAILAKLAHVVISVERHEALALSARARLDALELSNVSVIHGDGSRGWPEGSPYDAIIVTAAGPEVPAPLKTQLAEGGRLVCPAGNREVQKLVKLVRHGNHFERSESINCVFVPLLGAEGWQRE